MKDTRRFESGFIAALVALGILAGGSSSAQGQAYYTPNNWVNDPYTTNANWTLLDANTTHPTYTNHGTVYNANLLGNSPIGSTITLNNIGDSIILTCQVSYIGSVNNANVQSRWGLYYKGTNLTDVSWGGYMIGQVNYNGSGGIYLRNLPSNSGIYGSGTGTSGGSTPDYLYSATWAAATYDLMLSVTKLSPTSTLMRWKITGLSPNTYNYSGRYTNNSATTTGGFTFDQVGFLSGGGVWGAAGGVIAFTNLLVTVGSFSDGSWTNDASGLWSGTGNWINGVAANGSGFIADFSQVNLTADRTVTLDSSRTIGRLILGATSGSTYNWLLNSSGGSVLTLNPESPAAPIVAVNQNTATVNHPVVSANGLTKTGAGTLALRGTNTIVGALNLNGGTLNFLSLSNLPLSYEAISAINFGGGALQWAPGNTFDISSVGIPISFPGRAGFDTGPNNVSLAGSFGDGGAGGLTKLGTGTLTLNNPVYYTGATTISNGVLALGSSGSIPSSTNITVHSGATFNVSAAGGLTLYYGQTLAGSGTVVGNVSDSSGAIIAPGTSAGTLTVNGNLALTGGGALNFELSDVTTPGSGINDMIAVTGNLNIAGPTTLNLSLISGAPGLGTYTLFTYNTFTGSEGNLSAPAGFVVTNDTVAQTIGLAVTHIPADLTWQGDGSGNVWDIGTTANWLQSGTNQVFFTGDAVTFDSTGSVSPPVNISATVSPSAVTVNDSRDYTFYTLATGGIGTGRLTKSGTGTLTVETDNTYGGSTVINAGTLQVGGFNLGGISGTLGTGPTTNNGALVFNRSTDYTYTNVIRGTGSITNIGSAGTVTLSGSVGGSTMNMAGFGTMVLSGSNSYTGQTIIASGSLNPRDSAALGTSAAGTVIQSGGRLYIDANIDISGESVSVAGIGPDTAGALRKGGNGVTTLSGSVTLTADAMIAVDGGSTFNLTNTSGIAGSGFSLTLAGAGNGTVNGPITLGTGSLTKNDGGTWTVAPTNNYTGKTFINGGVLAIPALTALGTTAAVTPDFVTLNGGSLAVTTNLTFDDGLRGFTANGSAGGFNVGAGLTLVVSNHIAGSGTITKTNAGTLVLRGPNSFSGTLNVDSAINAGDDGTVIVAHPQAITAVASPIAIRNSLGGVSTLELDGSSGNITVSQAITLTGRSPTTPAIKNSAGNNTLAGNFTLAGSGTRYVIQSDSGLLTLSGIVSNGTIAPQTLTFQGNGNLAVTGVILDDATNAISVVKDGNGTLTLSGANTYGGSTTVNGGVLAGTGSINGPVSISSGGTLSPGTSIGTLTIKSNLTLAGLVAVEINKTAGTSDRVLGLSNVVYGGTLTVTNLSGTLTTNDTFQLFSAAASSGDFASVAGSAGSGLKFSFNPATGILSIVPGYPSEPPTISFNVSGDTLTLSWPAAYSGYLLQSQTNALNVGLSTNWHTISGSGSSTQAVITVNPANPTVFYRLLQP